LATEILRVYRQVGNSEVEIKKVLVASLGLTFDPAAVEPLVSILETEVMLNTNDTEALKAYAIGALGTLRQPEAADAILRFVDHPSAFLRKYAVFNAGSLCLKDPRRPFDASQNPPRTEIVETLRSRLQDPVLDVSWNAAFALAYFARDGSGIQLLRQMLDRTYVTKHTEDVQFASNVVRMACLGARGLGDPSLRPEVEKISQGDPDPEVRRVADAAVRSLTSRR
jgi:hypothetical protein